MTAGRRRIDFWNQPHGCADGTELAKIVSVSKQRPLTGFFVQRRTSKLSTAPYFEPTDRVPKRAYSADPAVLNTADISCASVDPTFSASRESVGPLGVIETEGCASCPIR